MDRNLSISQAESKKGESGYQEILIAARTQAYKGQFDPLAWLKCFKHPTAQDLGLQYDRRFEAAEMLCSCGYTEPARMSALPTSMNSCNNGGIDPERL